MKLKTTTRNPAGILTNQIHLSQEEINIELTTEDGQMIQIQTHRATHQPQGPGPEHIVHITLNNPKGDPTLQILQPAPDRRPLASATGHAQRAAEDLVELLQKTEPDNHEASAKAKRALIYLREIKDMMSKAGQ